MSYAKLKGKIIEVFGTQGNFAKAMGMHHCTLTAKLNGARCWTSDEIALAIEILHIPDAEIAAYFFSKCVACP